MKTCPTCGHTAANPFRSFIDNRIALGCVDEFHTDHLVQISSHNLWHRRKEARFIRKDLKQMLMKK